MTLLENHVVCYVGLGSNLGDSLEYLQAATKAIYEHPKVCELSISHHYQSKPHGPQDQPDYLNAAIRFKTTLEAEAVLDMLQDIENKNKRVREGVERWGARTLDLDLLFYGDKRIDTRRLTVPHPHICERVFVLLPLRDLVEGAKLTASDLIINKKTTLQDCIDKLSLTEMNSIKDLGNA